MTMLLEDIRREPHQLSVCIQRLMNSQFVSLQRAAEILLPDMPIYIVGIGSSWNAALAVASMLSSAGYAAVAADASELLHFTQIPRGATCIVLSRSGRSVEIVRLLDKCQSSKMPLIAVTNASDSPLAQRATLSLLLDSPYDHMVSISMYSMLALVGCLLAELRRGTDLNALGYELIAALGLVQDRLEMWVAQIQGSRWLSSEEPVYFLARGTSVASCHEARLLWEEAAKRPATALTTGSFRHGSQEMIRSGVRIGLCLQDSIMWQEDLLLALDLQKAGASVLLAGPNLPNNAADLVFDLPTVPQGWQFLMDIIPFQLAAEFVAKSGGEDCDTFRFCPYVIEEESGLIGGRTGK